MDAYSSVVEESISKPGIIVQIPTTYKNARSRFSNSAVTLIEQSLKLSSHIKSAYNKVKSLHQLSYIEIKRWKSPSTLLRLSKSHAHALYTIQIYKTPHVMVSRLVYSLTSSHIATRWWLGFLISCDEEETERNSPTSFDS